FRARMFAGTLTPADLTIRREIILDQPEASDATDVIDTAYYEDVRENLTITELVAADESTGDPGVWRVAHVEEDAGGLSSGVDVLRNIERLQFGDGEVVMLADWLGGGAPVGTIGFSTLTPTEDVELCAIPDFTAPDNPGGVVDPDDISYAWQWGDDEGEWTPSVDGVEACFTPGDAEAGRPLRVIGTYQDVNGTTESVTSQSTMPVTNVNDEPTGPSIDNRNPFVGAVLTADQPVDADGTHNDDGDLLVDFRYQWQQKSGDSWNNISGARANTFTVTQAQEGKQLRVTVSYTDLLGTDETAVSEATEPVVVAVPPAAPQLTRAAAGPGSVTLGWSPPSDDGGAQLVGFALRIVGGSDGERVIDGIGPEETSLVVTDLEVGTEYTFSLMAFNAAGHKSPYSPTVTATPVA